MLSLILLMSHFIVSTADEQKKQQVVLGSSDYLKVVNSSAFVDKTMLIKEVYKFPRLLITAPRKFGKSTSLDMLRRFFSIPIDSLGQRDESKSEGIGNVFRQLDIYTHERNLSYGKKFFDRHFGRYPVLNISFEIDSTIRSVKMAEDTIKYRIHKCFKAHEYLCESDELLDEERNLCKSWCGDSYNNFNVSSGKVGLKVLSRCLYKHYRRRQLFVMVDNYDAVINSCITNVNGSAGYVISLITDIVSELIRYDQFVERSVVTGTSCMVWLGLSKLVDVKVCSFQGDHSLTYFSGFQKHDVDRLLIEFNTTKNHRHYIHNWYNGYTSNTGIKTYNPFSVLTYLKTNLIEHHWLRNETVEILNKPLLLESFRNKLETIRKADTVHIKLQSDISITDIGLLEEIYKYGGDPTTQRSDNIFLSFLCEQGFLILEQKIDVPESESMHGSVVKIPNKEMEDFYLEEIVKHCLNEILEERRKSTIGKTTLKTTIRTTLRKPPLRRIVENY